MRNKKIKVHSCSRFTIIRPICTVEKMEDGMNGYVRSDDIVIYTKDIESNKFYIRIKKDAPVYDNNIYEYSMVAVSKINNSIEIEVEEDIFFFADLNFNGDPLEFTNEEVIEWNDYNPDMDIDSIDEVSYIINNSKDIYDMHKKSIDYFYSSKPDVNEMKKIIMIIPAKIENRLSESTEEELKSFKEIVERDLEELEETAQDLEGKTKKDVEITNLKLYISEIQESINKFLIDEERLKRLSIDDLIEKEQIEKNPHRKEILRKIMYEKTKKGGGITFLFLVRNIVKNLYINLKDKFA